jgi:hypothetical protein
MGTYAYDLNDKELDQLEKVVRAKADYDLEQELTVGPGRILERYGFGTLDRRKVTRKVEKAAFAIGAIVMACPHGQRVSNPYVSRENMCSQCNFYDWRPQFHYLGSLSWFHMPAQLVYRLLKPALEESGGYSITKDAAWLNLGLEPRSTKYFESLDLTAQDRIISDMERVLGHLAARGFIKFQAIGDIWQVQDVQSKWIPEELVYLTS